MLAGIHCHLASITSREKADEFITRLMTGEKLTRDMVEYKLRKIYSDHTNTAYKMSQESLCIATLKGWNSFISGNQVKVLKVLSDENRPKILTK